MPLGDDSVGDDAGAGVSGVLGDGGTQHAAAQQIVSAWPQQQLASGESVVARWAAAPRRHASGDALLTEHTPITRHVTISHRTAGALRDMDLLFPRTSDAGNPRQTIGSLQAANPLN